ncbi:MAG: hypothetical protein H7Z70_07295 [Bacteroidia bacterium]|nr:hypothetical protein [Methylotenera sp.]
MAVGNVFNIPVYGKPITLDDQGIYYAKNRKTGGINNVFNLVYEDDDEWYLYQLKNTDKDGEMGWVILADNGDYPLKSISTENIKHYFDKPEYQEPKGAWQLMRNSRYGFGKFTPIHLEQEIRYAMILFSGTEMLVPLLILKAEDGSLQSLGNPNS